MTDEIDIHEPRVHEAAALMYAYGLALGVDKRVQVVRNDSGRIEGAEVRLPDHAELFRQAGAYARQMHDSGVIPEGLPWVQWLDASALVLRNAAQRFPDRHHDLIGGAEDIETARDLAIATMPRPDA